MQAKQSMKEVDSRKIVAPRPLEEGEICCVCCDFLKQEEDLSHCRYGCGRLIHTDCLIRCFKHNYSNRNPMNCPLCRTDWGDKGIEILQENQKAWRAKKKKEAEDKKRAELKFN